MVCLLSPFPETLWAKTALGKGIEVSLNQSLAYRPSQQWQIDNSDSLIELDFRFETKRQKQQYLKDCLRLPVLNLTPQSLSAWSGVVDGDPNCSCAGYLLDVPDDSVSTTDLPAPSYQSRLSPEQVQSQLRFFRRNASPKAWQLMRRLSTVPINLAVMRLIQKQLIPKSDPVELAEVLFSGLLRPRQSTYDFYTPPDSLRFDMLEPARQMLREDLGTTRSIEVIAELSTFIANKLGLTFQKFEARLMTNPQSFEGQDGVLVEAFARMTAEVFELSGRLGIAQQLRESQAKIRVARQQQQEKAFLDQFQAVSKTVETANLVILDGEEEARFEQVCQELDGFSLE